MHIDTYNKDRSGSRRRSSKSALAHVRYLFFSDFFAKGEEPPDTGGGRVFSLDATYGLLATRRRLWRRGGFSALRSAFVL